MKVTKRRFFYHYRRFTDGMTVHFHGQCISVRDVKCLVPCETKRNKKQPHLVMQGFCSNVEVKDDVAYIT